MSHPYSWAALLGLLAAAGAAKAQTAPSFAPVVTYSAGAGSNLGGIAVADVNGDGKPDLLTSNYGSNTAGVLLGTGTGTFGAVATYSTGPGSSPVGIVVADVNGDGKPDLLTANHQSGTAGVLLGTGTGSFGPVTTYGVGTSSQPNNLAVADVNGDGKPDLLTANNNSSAVGVLLGTGTGTFGPATLYSTGTNSGPVGIVVADANGDGKPDLLTSNFGTYSVGVLLGTGTGSFGPVTAYSNGSGNTPGHLMAADVNGDGKIDLLVANYLSSTAGVLLGTGTGSFGPATTYGTGSGGGGPNSLALADVNGDGKPDLLTVSNGSNTAGVLLGTGTGSFGPVTAYSTGSGSQPFGLAVADVNNDRRPDLLTANGGNNAAGVLLNTGTYTPLATPAALAAEAVVLYPNPAHGRLHVALPAGAVQATLLDALGRVVRQQPGDGPTLTLDTEGLAPGLYTLRLQAGATTLARRVVLE